MLDPAQWQKVSPYLDEALAMPQGERAAWLGNLRARSPEVGRLLEVLLEEHRRLDDEHFLEDRQAPAGEPVGLAGQPLGPYTLLAPIGHGGMSSVWLAGRSDGRFERRVAIKFLSIALAGGGGEVRFLREGSILGRLAHPHIAELIDAGVSPSGQPYLVLEYVDGEHIDRYCDQNRLSVNARIRLFLDVLAAVAHAHSNLIVHRDLKPSNVLVRTDGDVKLLDFGIAKLLEEQGGAAALLTIEAGRPMTPEYAAPEQLTGGLVTTSTDVYGLGVLLYLLLTGQHPAGDGPHSYASLVKAVTEHEPARPSDVAGRGYENYAAVRGTTPERLSRLLRADLDNIVLKALKKDPGERYSSAAALAGDLRRYLRNEPVRARPDTMAYRAAKFVRRNRVAVTLASLAALATVAGLVGTLIQAHTARVERDFALRQVKRTAAINEFHQFLVSDAAPWGKRVTAHDVLSRAEQMVARQHAANDPIRVELMISIGRQYSEQDEARDARRVLEEAYRLSRGLPDASVRAAASCVLAASVARDEETVRAEKLIQQGLHEIPSGAQFALERILCLENGSEVAQQGNEVWKGVARAREAVTLLKQSPFDSDVLEMHAWTDLAQAYSAAGKDEDAISAFEAAGHLMSSLGRDETVSGAVLFNDWALELDQVGRPLEAEKMFRRAMEVSGNGGTEDTVSPMTLNNYARTLRELGRTEEAAAYAERAYAKAQRAGHQLAMNQSLLERARIYLQQHDPARAEAMLAQVEPRLRNSLPPGHYAFAALAEARALTAFEKDNGEDAMALADQSVAIDEAAIKAGHDGLFFLPTLLIARAEIELGTKRAEKAAADAGRVLQQLERSAKPGKPSSLAGQAYLLLGRALLAEAKQPEAQTALRAAGDQLEGSVGPNHPDTLSARQLAALR